jgi:hypothetical protein
MIQMRCMEQCTPANKAGCLSFASGRLRVQRMCDPAGIPGGVFLLLGFIPTANCSRPNDGQNNGKSWLRGAMIRSRATQSNPTGAGERRRTGSSSQGCSSTHRARSSADGSLAAGSETTRPRSARSEPHPALRRRRVDCACALGQRMGLAHAGGRYTSAWTATS